MYKLYTFFDGCNVLVLPLQHFTFVLNQIALTTMKRLLNRMLRFYKIRAASFFRRVTRPLKKPTRLEAAEKTDAGRVAPIRACVFYQIDRLKSGFEAMGRTVMPGICALMGATRPASVFSAASSRGAFFSSLYFTQIEEEIQQYNRLCYQTSPPLVLAFLQCVSGNFPQNVLSKKSILNTQPYGSAFEFAPTDNRHEVTVIGVCALHVFSPSVPCGSPSV